MRDLTKKRRSDSEMTQKVPHISPDMAPQVTRLSDVIAYLRTVMNKDLPIQHIALLLAVVQQPGISMQDLMTHLGMPQGSVSRNVKLLSIPGRGYEFLSTSPGLTNRKQIVVFPTEKCTDLIVTLCRLMRADMQEEVNRGSCDVAAC